jgi:hypothetical protein
MKMEMITWRRTSLNKSLFLGFLVSILTISACFSQSGEIGLGLGTMNYRGEISPKYDFYFQRPSGMLFYRHNFSPIFSLRGSFTAGMISATNERYSDPLSKLRPLKFNATIYEVAAMPEYNFFNFRGKNNIPKATFYFTSGVAVFRYTTNAPQEEGAINPAFNFAIPMGFGMLGDLTNIGLEFGARKTFNDFIDGTSDTFGNGVQRGFRYDKDWYYYAGISISYIIYKIPCPYFTY